MLNGEATKVINLGIYDNTALKPDIYFCDKVGVIPNNSLRWQYKILLKYDEELGAYEVVATDAAKASANSLGVEWTHAISSASIKVNSYATVGQYVVLSKEVVVSDTNFTASVGSKEQVGKVLKEFTYTIETEFTSANPTKEHYEFAGWVEGDKISIGSTGAKTFTATWTPVEYTINYVLGGGTNHASNPGTYNIEDEVTLQNPTREHYEFVKWTEGSTISVGSYGEKTFTAEWTPVEYEITLALNGGEGETSVKYNIETETFELPKPTRQNYVFKGWFANEELTGDEVVSIAQGTTGAKTYYAKWEEAPYQIEYETNGGSSLNSTAFSLLTGLPTELPVPTKEGYTFDGWYDNEELTGEKVTAIAEFRNYKLYASWTVVQYDIIYNLNGGENNESNPETYTIEEAVKLANPIRLGYEFVGWSNDGEIALGSTGNKEFVATWKAIEYDLTTELNGGRVKGLDYSAATSLVDFTLVYYNAYDSSGTTVTPVLFNPSTSGYSNTSYPTYWRYIALEETEQPGIFKITEIETSRNSLDYDRTTYDYLICWYVSGSFTMSSELDSIVTKKSSYIGDYILLENIPSASTKNANITCKVFDAADVKEITSYSANYTIENEYVLLDSSQLLKANYEFAGWYDNAEFVGAPVTSIEKGSTGNKTYYAKWIPVQYEITYVLNGGTNGANPATYTVEDTVQLVAPSKEHYEFAGWAEGNQITLGSSGNKIFTAQWTPVEYEITLVLNGGEGQSSVKYNIETEAFELPKPTKTDYIFKGWYVNEDLSGEEVVSIAKGSTGAKTYYAKWEEAPYQVEYEINGGTYGKDAEYFSLVTGLPVLGEPTKSGYTFQGWYDNDEFEGSKIEELTEYKNYKLYAKWSINTYTITYVNDGSEVENRVEYTVETETFELVNPSKEGYEFLGWYNGQDKVEQIEKGSIGSMELVAKYEIIEYTITYNLTDGTWCSYTYDELAEALLADYNAARSKTNTRETMFALGSWSEISDASLFLYNASYRAKWAWFVDYIATVAGSSNKPAWKAFNNYNSQSELNAANSNYIYEIAYELRAFIGGKQYTKNSSFLTADYSQESIRNGALAAYKPTNLTTSYTIEDSVVLPTPYKQGYKFVGWQEGSEIVKGSTGNKTFTAVWTDKAAFIGETGYNTITEAVAAANEGDTIKVVASVSENVTINKNNITILGEPLNSKYVTVSNMTISGSDVTIKNIKVDTSSTITITGKNNVEFENCYINSSAAYVIQFNADTSNFKFNNSILVASNSAAKGLYSKDYLATNIEINNSEFINTTSTNGTYPDAIRFQKVAGTINVTNCNFKWTSSNFTVYFGATSVAANTTINIKNNKLINNTASSSSYGQVCVRNLNATSVVNVIGNEFSKCGGDVIVVRGSSSSDTTTTATVNIKNNAIKDTSSKVGIYLATTNITIDSNYFYQAISWSYVDASSKVTNAKTDAASALAGANSN